MAETFGEMLASECALSPAGATFLAEYVAAQRDALGVVPTMADVVFERFFDEGGGMQLVVHAPFGGRVNRAFGLALRNTFLRVVRFRAAGGGDRRRHRALHGGIAQFPVGRRLSLRAFRTARRDAPASRVAGADVRYALAVERIACACAVRRHDGGKKVPPFLQRMRADDTSGGGLSPRKWPARTTLRPDLSKCPIILWSARLCATAS